MRLGAFVLLFSFTTGLVLAQPADSLVIQSALIKLKNAKAYTLQVAELMPADKYAFKPTPEEMSFGEQLVHLSANMGWLTSSFLGEGTNPVSRDDSKLQRKEDIQQVVTRAYDYAIETLSKVDPAMLKAPVKFFAGPMNKLQITTLLNDHQTHHRGQLMIYLRLNGIVPPKYVGW